MNYNIQKLRPELVDDYIQFFDTENHSDHIAEHKCYCVCWASDDHRSGLDKMSSAVKRRALAREYIINSQIKGYLAYDNQLVIGWCNTNHKADCKYLISWMRNLKDLKVDENLNTEVKSIFCFMVAPKYQRKGVATALLSQVILDAAKEGYQVLEAYPRKKIKQIDDFEGPLELYLKQGFVIKEEYLDYYVVRKTLD